MTCNFRINANNLNKAFDQLTADNGASLMENNEFLVVNQMKYHGKYQNPIPDLVVHINGLPMGSYN